MKLAIFGAEGNIGRRLMQAFPGSTGIDRAGNPDIRADLATIDYARPDLAALLGAVEGVVHVATSADVAAPDAVHFQAVIDAARLLEACRRHGVKRVVLPSSDWAEPKSGWAAINVYGHSKRVFEAMAEMYCLVPGLTAVALRIGWVPREASEVDGAAPWLKANYWDDARLLSAMRGALGL